MTTDPPLAAVADLCAQARAKLGTGGSHRLRTLLDMVLLELARPAAGTGSSHATPAPNGKPAGT